jgi:adsorption protein B
MGISMQEWANVGWQGNFATKYTLFHDRKITFTHFVNVFGYIVFGAWLIYFFWQRYHPYYPTLQEFFNRQPWVWYLIVICTIIMIETLLQRAIAVYRIYGLLPSLLSIPRAVYGNIINVHALFRAYRQYFRPSHKKGRVWEKTEHSFPTSSQLKKLRKKLGNILVENQIINESQLKAAIIEQMSSGKRLGDILIEGKYLTPKQLIRYLAIQEDLEFVEIKNFSPLEKSKLPKFSKRSYQWLIQNKIIPIITEGSNLVLAIPDPSNEIIKLTATLRSKPYNVKFVAYYDPDY